MFRDNLYSNQNTFEHLMHQDLGLIGSPRSHLIDNINPLQGLSHQKKLIERKNQVIISNYTS